MGNVANIKFLRSKDLERAASFTFENMRVYYEQFAPDWNASKVLEVTSSLENYDILYQKEVVGVMRLQFESEYCILRDLQVVATAQNKGIGYAALQEAKKRTLQANLNKLTLRVFKVSPAVNLYKRNGFTIQSEDDRFYNMEVSVD